MSDHNNSSISRSSRKGGSRRRAIAAARAWIDEEQGKGAGAAVELFSVVVNASHDHPRRSDDKPIEGVFHLLIGFFGGCIVAAVAVSFVGGWAWAFPIALAGASLGCAQSSGPPPTSNASPKPGPCRGDRGSAFLPLRLNEAARLIRRL